MGPLVGGWSVRPCPREDDDLMPILGFAQLNAGLSGIVATAPDDKQREGTGPGDETSPSPQKSPDTATQGRGRMIRMPRPRSSVASAPSASSLIRDDLAVEEQLIQLADEADDARLRALVSETPLAEREHRKASRHADRLRKHRDTLSAKVARTRRRTRRAARPVRSHMSDIRVVVAEDVATHGSRRSAA